MPLTVSVTGRDQLTRDSDGKLNGDLAVAVKEGENVLFSTTYNVEQSESHEGAEYKALRATKTLLDRLSNRVHAESEKVV